MQWMEYNKNKRRLSFKLEEHEIAEEMQHTIAFTGIQGKGLDPVPVTLSMGPKEVTSRWLLEFDVPTGVTLENGSWNFIVTGKHPFKGIYITATGFSHKMDFVCHQTLTKIKE